MTSMFPLLCTYCQHLDREVDELNQWQCRAFPDGIPAAILDSTADHRQPVEGDNGIQFVQEADMPAPPEDLIAELDALAPVE